VNSVVWILAFLSSLWISVWFYTEASDTVLGFMGIGLALFCLVMLLFAIADDIEIFAGRRSRRGRDDL
jgi:hypothetical protein